MCWVQAFPEKGACWFESWFGRSLFFMKPTSSPAYQNSHETATEQVMANDKVKYVAERLAV